MSPHFWRANEKVLVTRMYEAGAPLREIAAATDVSEDAIRGAVGRWKLHRPEGHIGIEMRTNLAWPRIRAALDQCAGMAIAELRAATGVSKPAVLKALAEHRDELHIARWIPTSRKPRAVWALGKRMDAPKPVRVRAAKRGDALGQMAAQLMREAA
ncbi:hypothetical protein [Burkholderia cenocepacia]|uniref:hypothetical protein n=1 Tax=Burkholderia cenocepacia TaxID=95486 RepID=UPI0020188918|nr:hypothetical protein [Burkholderia cenocepacia]MCO1396400.1 hypothetical protein [Burkholderia cenocepacia]MCO1408974.1 hypothetical protein [Burkholderia cenocepacia]UQN92051.1 hypothetical protein L0Z06_15125 [Burkholderia cenocepacia]UQN99200.1 hypothetical protein L0Z39_16915 [Burkholderia cenocepacia]UQP50845.1 hypothetical protein L0Y99_10330 [Burkholderia cenocepacia]